jgi:hypothetical protein
MSDNINRIQVTVRQMKRLLNGLEELCENLPKNPKLYALMSEAPLDHIVRMCKELDDDLEPLKHISPSAASTPPVVDSTIPTPAAPGPIESTS